MKLRVLDLIPSGRLAVLHLHRRFRPQHPPGHRSGLLTQDERVGRVSDGQYAHDFSLPGVNGLLLCGAEPSGASGERQRCGRAGRQYRFLFHDSRCFCEYAFSR